MNFVLPSSDWCFPFGSRCAEHHCSFLLLARWPADKFDEHRVERLILPVPRSILWLTCSKNLFLCAASSFCCPLGIGFGVLFRSCASLSLVESWRFCWFMRLRSGPGLELGYAPRMFFRSCPICDFRPSRSLMRWMRRMVENCG